MPANPLKRKLRALTTDDLLRRQEYGNKGEPKRVKRADLEEESDNSESEGVEGSKEGQEDIDSDASEQSQSDSDEEEGEDVSEEIAVEDRLNFKPSSEPTSKSVPPPRPSASAFSELGISPPLELALKSMSITVPTEVQAACIPPLLEGRDCVGNAKTGSGKTMAFALPILEKLSADPYGIFALVLTPTRELAFQISDQFVVLGSAVNLRTAVVVGGMDMMEQALELKNRPHVVVATPGRLVDLLDSGSGEWNLSRVKFLVLDEADRLLTDTFAPQLSRLFGVLPKERQTCLFTATLTPSIETIISTPPRPGKQKPFTHRMADTTETVSTLIQSYLLVPSHVRESYLYHVLRHPPGATLHLRRAPPEKKAKGGRVKSKPKSKSKKDESEDELVQPPPTIIFCTKPRTAAYLTSFLKSMEIRTTALHSRLTQRERLTSLSLFKSYVIPVLVSTDVGARGLDIEDVAIVINWDLPNEPEEYTHRVGRTARAGRGGTAISFVTERDEERVLKIEQRIKTKLEEMVIPESKVLEKLNAVSTAKRLANMELHDEGFGQREEIHKKKARQKQR